MSIYYNICNYEFKLNNNIQRREGIVFVFSVSCSCDWVIFICEQYNNKYFDINNKYIFKFY